VTEAAQSTRKGREWVAGLCVLLTGAVLATFALICANLERLIRETTAKPPVMTELVLEAGSSLIMHWFLFAPALLAAAWRLAPPKYRVAWNCGAVFAFFAIAVGSLYVLLLTTLAVMSDILSRVKLP
jgi:hypothetical protein